MVEIRKVRLSSPWTEPQAGVEELGRVGNIMALVLCLSGYESQPIG